MPRQGWVESETTQIVKIWSYKITPNVEHIPCLPRIYKVPLGGLSCICGAFGGLFGATLGAFRVDFRHTLNPLGEHRGAWGCIW